MWSCDPVLSNTILDSYHWAGPLFMSTLQALLAAQCALVGDHLWPKDATEEVLKDPNYDFIVVGAGSAGAVVANRLTEVPNWKVLLIEAGGNPTITTEVPQMFFNNFKTPVDWAYTSEPQDKACRSYRNRGCAWPRGKVLGGSSSINGLFYVRGNKLDYDEWEAAGNPGWSYKDVLPYFIKSENLTDMTNTPNKHKYHGSGGYLSVESNGYFHPYEQMIFKANEEVGVKTLIDVNGDDQMGVTRTFSTTKEGVRHSTARAFLSPIRNRPNLHVLKNTLATKILFKYGTKEAIGVQVHQNGKDFTINAKKEVIVSAGAVNTPQLLMLSGIGPKKYLEDEKIQQIADLPVGENLQDHVLVPIYLKSKSDMDLINLPNIASFAAEFINTNSGPLADTSPHKNIGFINTTDPKSTSPDIQQHYVVLAPNQSRMLDINQKHGMSIEFRELFEEINKDHILLKIYTVLLRPKSKGRIALKTSSAFNNPLIFANYFDEAEDIETTLRGIKFALKLAETKVLQAVGFELHWFDIAACRGLDKSSDEFLKCWASEVTFSLYHPVGTARMGPQNDPTAVVDHTLRVHGFEKLRVIDASVMPDITRGNTNAPTIMIAEKGADLIKKDWKSTVAPSKSMHSEL